ncbi:MAG: DUF4091 domain-containing protein [Lentisphaeria bacterium]|nr:DUF4091 domain-containing protein [Lentisphaeria bacterium]
MDLHVKLLDSMTKVMPTAKLPVSRELLRGSALRGEVYAFQLAYRCSEGRLENVRVELESPLAACTHIRSVGLIPAEMLTNNQFDENILTDQPGYFPDPLYELPAEGLVMFPQQYRALHIQVRIPEDQAPGLYEFKLKLYQEEKEVSAEKTFTLEVVDAVLPRQRIDHTEWFYCDCISNYYNCEVWSEEFWKLLENYFRSMADHGITQILTPILTPPLDTGIGLERKTAQLLDIETDGKGNWSFGFDRLKRWVELAKECGLRRFEFSHIFSQWGSEFAPKVVAKTPEGMKKVFGWETKSDSEEYTVFIKAMVGALADYVEQEGWLDCCCMHISDEPQEKHFERYRKNLTMIREVTRDRIPVCDALSHLGLFKEGENCYPVPIISEVPTFRKAGIGYMWGYYCCGPETVTTNRFLNFPGGRTRVLGLQLFNYRLDGFLHWGYNFWNTRLSIRTIDPYRCSDAGGLFPGGDSYLVYPGEDGKPVDSFRYELLREAFQDHRALVLLGELYGDEQKAIDFLHKICGGDLSVSNYPVSEEAICNIRHLINMEIKSML